MLRASARHRISGVASEILRARTSSSLGQTFREGTLLRAFGTKVPPPAVSRRPIAAPVRQPIPRSLTSPFPPLAEIPGTVSTALIKAPGVILHWTAIAVRWSGSVIWIALTDRERTREALAHAWAVTKEELHHYWVGSKLFVAELKTSSSLVRKVGRSEVLTWRERQQLRRSLGDLMRMVPFVILVSESWSGFTSAVFRQPPVRPMRALQSSLWPSSASPCC